MHHLILRLTSNANLAQKTGHQTKGPFTPPIYYTIVIAITILFKNGLYTHFCNCDCESYSPIQKNRNQVTNRRWMNRKGGILGAWLQLTISSSYRFNFLLKFGKFYWSKKIFKQICLSKPTDCIFVMCYFFNRRNSTAKISQGSEEMSISKTRSWTDFRKRWVTSWIRRSTMREHHFRLFYCL